MQTIRRRRTARVPFTGYGRKARRWHSAGPPSGFSLIELLVVMGIIGILVSLAVPAITNSRRAARRTQCLNNMRNVGMALLHATETAGRFPACGNFGRAVPSGPTREHHSWVVDALPYLDQTAISSRWDKDLPYQDPPNADLSNTFLPVLICPTDISVVHKPGESRGHLSFVVNSGIGFTAELVQDEHDCPVDPSWTRLDLNGNGVLCPQAPNLDDDGEPSDRDLLFRMGLFFNETWKWDVTVRHHRPATVLDGMTQTMLLSENVRTGYDPARPDRNWASSFSFLTSFYIGNPCPDRSCRSGVVDYSLSNSGVAKINAGLTQPEGESPYPSSFHGGGVHVMFCDGHVIFLSEHIDGAVYAALASPQGLRLEGTPLEQVIVSDTSF